MITDVDVGKLAELIIDRDQLRTDLHSCQVELGLVRGRYNDLLEHIKSTQEELERVRAEAAVMRSALDDICSQDYLTTCKDEDHPVSIASKAASSTDAGASLLASYREAVELLEVTKSFTLYGSEEIAMMSDWLKRRDTLLATVKGEVES